MNNNKGQAAIEFLVTYGWAILAAMIVIGALTYFGVTNPATTLPDKCVFSNGFQCQEYVIHNSPNEVRVKLINGFGQTIYNPGALLTDNNAACTVSDTSDWNPDDIREINCSILPGGPYNQKDKAKVRITMNYTKTPTNGYNQISLGEVYATVQ